MLYAYYMLINVLILLYLLHFLYSKYQSKIVCTILLLLSYYSYDLYGR